MEKLKSGMKDLDNEMEDMHIEIYGFNDGDSDIADLHAPSPPMPPHAFYFDGDENSRSDCDHGKGFSFQFHSRNKDVPDSLNDDNHIVVYGTKGEETPVLEKEITTKDGDKVFIFKRKVPKESSPAATPSMPVTKVKAYPNPGNGKLSISFTAASKGDVQVSITDAKGEEVFTKSLKEFSGEYFDQVDLSAKGKGTYYLKITQGDDSITKKLVIE
jgi:hypothetical protein